MKYNIFIEDVYACGGSCSGCTLSINERITDKPDMSIETMDLVLFKLNEYFKLRDKNKTDFTKDIADITFLVGDHIRMPVEYMLGLYKKTSDLLKENNFTHDYGRIYFSTSLIMESKKAIENPILR